MGGPDPIHVEIVTHCWRYSRLLMYQLSSLHLHPPEHVRLTMTVFHAEEDLATRSVLDFFESVSLPNSIAIRRWSLPRKRLMQRAIGRNLAALASDADWVWFADCDYVFGDGALDSLSKSTKEAPSDLLYPGSAHASRLQVLGDQAIESASGEPRIVTINPADFAPQSFTRAIGGVQIVRGDLVRKIGYCNGRRLLGKRKNNWQNSVGDVLFRRIIGCHGEKITIPNLFRIRHSTRGYRHSNVNL